MKKITMQEIKKMSYVELMAFLEEINRPPGGRDSIRRVVQNCFISKDSKVLDIGCNTGYCTFEIAHLARCQVIGVDINSKMIEMAEKFKKNDPLKKLINFKVSDAINLPFRDQLFDVVVSGGSTAFITDKEKALKEYGRVLRPWGFVADINFYYKTKPPLKIINNLNKLMNTSIKPWGIKYWLNAYEKIGFEQYFVYTNSVKRASRKEIESYCNKMIKQKNLTNPLGNVLRKKLISIMDLFNKNHEYLAYAIFILRKRPSKEQDSLFGM